MCGKNRRLHGGRLCRKEDVLIYSRCETWPGKLARCLYWLCFITRLCFRWELCSASPSWPPDTQSQERGWPAARPGFVMRRAEGFSQSTLLPLPQCHKENRGSQNAWVERDPKAQFQSSPCAGCHPPDQGDHSPIQAGLEHLQEGTISSLQHPVYHQHFSTSLPNKGKQSNSFS